MLRCRNKNSFLKRRAILEGKRKFFEEISNLESSLNLDSDTVQKLEELLNVSENDRIDFCKRNFKLLSDIGTTRNVYILDDSNLYVLKVAKNSQGIKQNKHESNPKFEAYPCFAKNYYCSKDNSFLISEYIETPLSLSKSDKQLFSKITGINFFTFRLVMENCAKNKAFMDDDPTVKLVVESTNEFISSLVSYIKDNINTDFADMTAIRNLGVTSDGHLKILDYGL